MDPEPTAEERDGVLPVLQYETPVRGVSEGRFAWRAVRVGVPFALWSGLFLFVGGIVLSSLLELDGERFDLGWIPPIFLVSAVGTAFCGALAIFSCWVRIRVARTRLRTAKFPSLPAVLIVSIGIVLMGQEVEKFAIAWFWIANLASGWVLLRRAEG